MKKALLAIVAAACMAMGFNGWFYASPANAVTCAAPTAKAASTSFTPDPGSTNSGTWLITTRVDYTRCTTGYGAYAKNITVRVFIDKQQGYCGRVYQWSVNPDVLGGWNPGTKNSNSVCANPVLAWYGPSGLNVYSTGTAASRCLGGTATAHFAPAGGSASKALAQVCIV